MYTAQDRYQFQPFYIKAYRWLRWRPFFAAKAVVMIARWLIFSRQIPNHRAWRIGQNADPRFRYLKSIWFHCMGVCDVRMRWYYTTAEVMQELADRNAFASWD
jgi:hypothetical protein